MKNILKTLVLFMSIATLTSCNKDDGDGGIFPVEVSKTYQLGSVSNPSISGTAKFIKNIDNSTTIELQLTGTAAGVQYPAHIHFNTAAESGAIALTLGVVNGDTGFSSITTSTLMDDSAITYEELLDFDGYINVHNPVPADLSVLVAQGDIGQNELTTTTKTYNLGSVVDATISGNVTFTKRVNNETLAVIQLDGTSNGDMHPAHIHINTAAEQGAIAYTFNPVNGDTGISKSNIAVLTFNDADPSNDVDITYDELMDFDGYINVHLSANNLTTLIAQGDIGQNELTGMTKSYVLNAVSVPTISGTIKFDERVNGETLATIALVGTVPGVLYPAHIHMGSVATAPGAIVIGLTSVNGTSGISKTNITMKDFGDTDITNDEAINYGQVTTIDGYVNVHNPVPTDLSVLVAQGNVGSNN